MKAFVRKQYGGPEQLRLQVVGQPQPTEGQVVIRTHAISINPAEWHILRAKIWMIRLTQGLFRPKHSVLGGDVAGIIEAVGKGVAHLKRGDRVFGRADHSALAEYAVLDGEKVTLLPDSITFEAGAALPLVSITAMSAIEVADTIGPESVVLINGASGGIGTMAIQIAKAKGATVYAICSQRNSELVKELGADQSLNYENGLEFDHNASFDVVFDLVGNLPLKRIRRQMKPHSAFVMVGYSGFGRMFCFLLFSIFQRKGKRFLTIDAKTTQLKLHEIAAEVSKGNLQPVIDRVYSFEETPAAFYYLGTRRARGKVVIKVNE